MSTVARRNLLKLCGMAGVITVVGESSFAQEKKDADKKKDYPDKKSPDKWRAWAVTEGEHTKLVVEGIYSEGGPGKVVVIKDAVPQGINPKILLLELKIATLPGVWPAVLQPIPGHYTKSPYKKDQYDSIQIRYPGNTIVSIDKIIDAGSGPT